MRIIIILCSIFLFKMNGMSQWSQAERDTIQKYTQIDYQNMLEQLGIDPSLLRPGPSGNPRDENAANSTEEKIPPYTLPDPLLLSSGIHVETESDWWNKKRPETTNLLEVEMYGKLPETIPKVDWVVLSQKDTLLGNLPVLEKLIRGTVDNASYRDISVEIEMLLVIPQNTKGAIPVITHFGWINNPWNNNPIEPISLISQHEPSWKEQIIMQGWGFAILVPSSIQADNGAGLTKGIIGLCNNGSFRKPDQWGALRAWAWGVSRAIDYFETDPDVDASRIAIEGLSRYGKAAIVAMAFEPRISLGFIGSSGAGGTKILRRIFGEQIENLASSGEYHWFCGNFIKYKSIHTVHDLPVDAHNLIALCAPRPVFISSGSPMVEGNWVDGKGMFLGGLYAAPVYNLLGKKDYGTDLFPPLGYPLVEGELAFRQHAGGHSTGPNWSTWIGWASRYWD